ncbi:hypothetical protein [Endozoicomonas lisbonensis]|uniref:hypothetical protein n=1 Tax=Endozoicomonas lisbonensis TaxID=3120522 RepID=UPI003399B305
MENTYQVTFNYDNEAGRFRRIEVPGYATLEAIQESASSTAGGTEASANENPVAVTAEELLPVHNMYQPAAAARMGFSGGSH